MRTGGCDAQLRRPAAARRLGAAPPAFACARCSTSSVQISSIWASSAARSPALSTTHVATLRALLVGRLQRDPPLGVVARHAARLEPVEPHRRAAPPRRSPPRSRSPRFDSTSSGTSCTTIAVGRRLGDPAEELLADRRMRDRLELLLRASSVTNALAASAARSSEPSGVEDLGAERARPAWPAPACPGSTTSRAMASASTTTAPRRASIPATVDLPGADPAGQPDHQHGAECTSGGAIDLRTSTRRNASLRVRFGLPRTRVGRVASARLEESRRARPSPDRNRPKASAAWPRRSRRATMPARASKPASSLLTVATPLRSRSSPASSSAILNPPTARRFVRRGDRARRLRGVRRPSCSCARGRSSTIQRRSTIVELVVTVGAIMATGGFTSPFILTPVTGLLLAGYVWGRRATVGTAVAGAIAAAAPRSRSSRPTRPISGAAGQIAVIFLLCGALGAFTRNLVVEIETPARRGDRPGHADGDRQRPPRLAARARADAAGVVRPRRGGRVDPPTGARAVPLHRARRARARRRRGRLAAPSSPKACASRPASPSATSRSRSAGR